MNHQTAKIAAESYRAEARAIFDGHDANPMAGQGGMGWRDRSCLLHDHAAVWERVAERLPKGGQVVEYGLEAPHVP